MQVSELVYTPNSKIYKKAGDAHNFLNAVSGASALYLSAKRNYDAKMRVWENKVAKANDIKVELEALQAYMAPWSFDKSNNLAGEWNAAMNFVLGQEGYGFESAQGSLGGGPYGLPSNVDNPMYLRWIPRVSLRSATNNTTALTNDNWFYIYMPGQLTGEENYRRAMKDIIRKWWDALKSAENNLSGQLTAATRAAETAKKNVDDAKKELDEAIAAEERASGQRIKENQSDPAYIAAQAKLDEIKAKAAQTKRATNVVLILGGLGILATAAILILRKS